jgi:hypothetical protein
MVEKGHNDIFNTAAYGRKIYFTTEQVYYPGIEDDSRIRISKEASICFEQKSVPPRKFALIFVHSISR